MVFDGGGFKISKINIKRNVAGYGLGIFGIVSGSAITIKNVTFDKIIVDSRDATGEGQCNIVDMVMGYAYSKTTFDKVTVTNSEVYGYGKIGILVGSSSEPGNTLSFKDCVLSNNTLSGAYNLGGLMGLYLRNTTDNSEKVSIENVSIINTNVVFNCKDNTFEQLAELANASITCEEGKSSTCLGNGSTFSGQYTKCNKYAPTYYYFGFYGKYYISYGQSSHDCKATCSGSEYLIANSEKCINKIEND